MLSLRLSAFSMAALVACAAFAQAGDAFWTRQGPDPSRSALVMPPELRARVAQNVGRAGQPLGYSFEQMLGFPTFEYRLRTVENLFRDVMAPPEYGGLLGDNLLDKANEPAQLAYVLWSQLDSRAGREWAVPTTPGDWGVPWIPEGTSATNALALALAHGGPSVSGAKGTPEFKGAHARALSQAGEPVVRLLARLVIAGHKAAEFLKPAVPEEIYAKAFRGKEVYGLADRRRAIYDMLVSPYLGDVNDDTIIVSNRGAYDAMRQWDKNYSAFGSAMFLRHMDAAMKEFQAASKGAAMPAFKSVTFSSELGQVVLGGSGDDKYAGGAFLSVDLGGKDTYTGLTGAPIGPENPVSVTIDMGGDDTYDGTGVDGNLGCGLFGLGLILDVSGNDTYRVKNGGIGFGLYGSGMVIDQAGDDTYRCEKGWAQGAAYAGVGLLLDNAGDDHYVTTCMSMGFGGTMGIGALVDVSGKDDYYTQDTGNDSKAWGKSVSMCLGCGYGRRCDSGDGENQEGGIGVVVEGGGNDTYHTGIFCLGSGYWWGAGIFEERGGDDTYRFTHYCLGSGAHFAIGSFVDLKGNDRYNDRPDAVERWGGLGRDGSVAVCIDGEGNDVWGNLTGGHCDLNSYALFWDRSGDDVYKRMQPFDPAQMGNRPYGFAVTYPPMRNFRDRLPNVGIFLDTAGKDTYPVGMTAADGTEWRLGTGPLFWGYGLDANEKEPAGLMPTGSFD